MSEMRSVWVCIATLMVVGIAAADDGWRTEPPITYVLDYGYSHLGYPE